MTPKRGKFYSKGLNTVDWRIGEVWMLNADINDLLGRGMKEF
jgi:hypothetical protein